MLLKILWLRLCAIEEYRKKLELMTSTNIAKVYHLHVELIVNTYSLK